MQICNIIGQIQNVDKILGWPKVQMHSVTYLPDDIIILFTAYSIASVISKPAVGYLDQAVCCGLLGFRSPLALQCEGRLETDQAVAGCLV